ncbi:MAG: type II toxin-antitoxin system RelE/ParE family toxin [Sulfuricellaceae bacterium]|nr:type II toxin-antitoxin system RelE/ParE family toxin [Sulfuricellaceae bacterium]
MKLQIHSLAYDDLLAGRDFYEMQQAGLGAYFLDTLFSDIESLLLHAGVHVRVFGYFRALSRRFPYALYYKLNGEVIEIWRVLDCRQHPRRVREALRK